MNQARINKANRNTVPSLNIQQQYETQEIDEIVSFEHININGIGAHANFAEMTNLMGNYKMLQTGVFGINEHNLEMNKPALRKKFMDVIRQEDKYAQVSIANNTHETFQGSWKPGGTITGVTGKWAGRVRHKGQDDMGRWSWIDLQGKNQSMI